ncbi:hypothetical protein L7F22_041021 [Adiantum nelumboides]|nr:hypothetical protein [Adiantum nelumboides]
MDFIFDLPRTQSGHDGIWTIIDRFNKQAYFVPVKKTIKLNHLARLFVAQIFRLHGMPETIVSNRDPRFTSLFWKAIWENIGTRLQFSSSFHPQTDGQSEISNSLVLDCLKSYISDQKTQWERYSPLVDLPTTTRYTDRRGRRHLKLRKKSQERQKKAADRHRRDLKLKENDWVLLRFEKARLRKKKGKEELSVRYYGPFQITEQINGISFRLGLPDTWKIHNVFHVNLWKTFGDVPDDGEPDGQPEVEENEEILQPEQVLAHKSKFEFKLRLQEFIELVRGERMMDAIVYARKYLASWGSTNMKELQQAMATLAFKSNTDCAGYKLLFDSKQWDELINHFKQEFCKLYGMTTESLLHIHLQAGLSALKTPFCFEEGCTKEDPLSQEDFRQLAAPLPFSKHIHSKLVCYITKELMDEHNPPQVLPNGYVYSTNALEEMARLNDGKITCPRTGLVCNFSELSKAYIS